MKKALKLVLLSCITLWSLTGLTNQGLKIAKTMDAKDQNWHGQVSQVEMVLKNRHGQESRRKLKIKTLEVKGDGDKSITIFKSPKDVKGTAFLSHAHSKSEDDQWLFLPALKRVKRISSNNKSGPFMGSEFAYEDISSQEVDKYTYEFIRNEKVGGSDGFVIARIPVGTNSGYTKQLLWGDKDHYRTHKIEFYDRKKSLLKTLTFHGYKEYKKGIWRASKYHMVNHQTGKSTELLWNDIAFQKNLKSRDFDKSVLKRVR
ncbi:outer membrane lipoprotein-sorting protein [Bacteriovoracaceae bacterium]|nr:outer membrane lipoprotein-sorting protein [Bacteriovoracaceae bacterium]